MRIQITRNLGSGFPQWTEGEIRDVDSLVAEELLGKGLAESLPEAHAVLVPEPAEVPDLIPPEKKRRRKDYE